MPNAVTLRECKVHGLTEFSSRKSGGWRCKKCLVDAVQRRRFKTKENLKLLFGGKCQICGYDKYLGALEFHHLNPSNKSFEISKRQTMALDLLKKEADKCILVCSNCHKEIHAGLHLLDT